MMHYSRACQKQDFEASLCGCCSDCGACCYAYFCYPCALANAWSDARGESCTCCHLHAWEIFVKANIRQARGMQQALCEDWCTNLFCPICSLVQDIREIKFIQAESRIADSHSGVVINYTSSNQTSFSNNNSQQPPQQPYGIPQGYGSQGYIPNQAYLPDQNQPQPYVQPNYPQNYPQPYQPPQFMDNTSMSNIDDKPNDQ